MDKLIVGRVGWTFAPKFRAYGRLANKNAWLENVLPVPLKSEDDCTFHLHGHGNRLENQGSVVRKSRKPNGPRFWLTNGTSNWFEVFKRLHLLFSFPVWIRNESY